MNGKQRILGTGIGPTVDLRALSPFESMEEEVLGRIRRGARLREYSRGDVLFRQGEQNEEVLYVLAGSVELQRDGRRLGLVRADTEEARRPLSKAQLHWHSAEVLSRHAQILAIDAERLDVLLTLEQTGSYRVLDIQDGGAQGDGDDWMVQALRSRAFKHIPPVNIQAMFMRLERRDVKAGDVVIRQGDEGDYFYVIARGSCLVTRDMPIGNKPLVLAELGVGASFGEEALIAGGKRSASVSMVTDGTLMRLGRSDFRKLCSEPIIRELTLEQARRVVRAGGRWLDVRLPSEITTTGIRGALAVPLYLLRLRMEALPAVPLVAVCDTGRRSSVAAFVLAQNGFEVAILAGGLSGTTPDFMERGETERLRALAGSSQMLRHL